MKYRLVYCLTVAQVALVPGLRDKLVELKSSKHSGIRQRAAATLQKLPEASQVAKIRTVSGRGITELFSKLTISVKNRH